MQLSLAFALNFETICDTEKRPCTYASFCSSRFTQRIIYVRLKFSTAADVVFVFRDRD